MKVCADCLAPMARAPQAKRCAVCAAAAQRRHAREWSLANRDRHLASIRQWNRDNPRARTPELVEYQKVYARAYRRAQPQRVSGHLKASRARHLEQRRMADRTWQHNRRGAPGKLARDESAFLLDQPCAYCGSPAEHVEHCTPLSRGGRNDIFNCVGACAACNLSKGRKTVLEFTGLL